MSHILIILCKCHINWSHDINMVKQDYTNITHLITAERCHIQYTAGHNKIYTFNIHVYIHVQSTTKPFSYNIVFLVSIHCVAMSLTKTLHGICNFCTLQCYFREGKSIFHLTEVIFFQAKWDWRDGFSILGDSAWQIVSNNFVDNQLCFSFPSVFILILAI